MWKYVSRRLRETFERAYNVDFRKSWSCGAQQTTTQTTTPTTTVTAKDSDSNNCTNVTIFDPNENINFWSVRCNRSNSSSKNGSQEKNRKRISDGDETTFKHDLLGAITLSGAIICGWYASQLLCLHRRQNDWSRKCFHANLIKLPIRELHTNFLSHLAFTSPVQPSLLSEKALKENFSFNYAQQNINESVKDSLFEISNDHEVPPSEEIPKQQTENVQNAVEQLVEYLGEVEFRIGVQSLAAGEYNRAILHLKLATNHNHPGATFNLGLCYEKGLGVTKNLRRAMQCYQSASAMGHSKAIYNLGVFYAQGLGGLKKDYGAARECFIAAAKLGQPEAKLVLKQEFMNDNDKMKNMVYKNDMEKIHHIPSATFGF